MKNTNKLLIALTSAFLLLGLSAPAWAETTDSASGGSENAKSTLAEQAKEKLQAAHEKSCATRKNTVTTIEKRVANRGQARLDTITKIAQKVEAYITKSNLNVANYDSLVGNINAKKDAAQTAIDTTKNDPGEIAGVTCQNGDGKAKVESFKKDMKAQQEALQAYRQAVKDLISAAQATKSPTGGEQ